MRMNDDNIFNSSIPTKVIGYGRVSTPGQADNWSPGSQRDLYADLRNQFNWGDEELIFEVGSGTSLLQRPKMRELLARIEKNNGDGIQAIWVVEQSRLARPEEYLDFATICDVLQRFDIKVVVQRTVTEVGGLLFDVNSLMAKAGRRELLRNLQRGKMQKGKSGQNACGSPPDGYTVQINSATKKSGKYVPDEKRAYIILLIFELADQDYTVRGIKKELEKRGIPSFRGGKQGWSTTHIHNVLTNRQYLGIYIQGITKFVKKHGYRPKKVLLEAPEIVVGTEDNPNHPPLVPKELFYRVQEKLKLRKKRQKSGFELLTGTGVCYECGELMRVWYTGSGKKCYVCKNKAKKSIGCKSKWLEVRSANPSVWNKFRLLMERPLVIRELYKTETAHQKLIEEQESQKKSYESQLDKSAEKKKRLLDLYLDGGLDRQTFEERDMELSPSIDFLKENIRKVTDALEARHRSQQDPTERLIHAIIMLRFSEAKFTEEQKQKIFRKFVYRVPFLNDRFEFDIQFYQDPLRDLPANLCSSHF